MGRHLTTNNQTTETPFANHRAASSSFKHLAANTESAEQRRKAPEMVHGGLPKEASSAFRGFPAAFGTVRHFA
eukprot:2303813-Alexandrium_andersonii.AAC.1